MMGMERVVHAKHSSPLLLATLHSLPSQNPPVGSIHSHTPHRLATQMGCTTYNFLGGGLNDTWGNDEDNMKNNSSALEYILNTVTHSFENAAITALDWLQSQQ